MKMEYLEDYQEKETQLADECYAKVIQGTFGSEETFPDLKRFNKLQKPYALSWRGASIWPQIPLFGSLIIPIVPYRKQIFDSLYGFNLSDIPKLVDFSKDTGKVQFGLVSDATAYFGLDYLEPIFTELRPPLLGGPITGLRLTESEISHYGIEFDTLASIRFYDEIENQMKDEGLTQGRIHQKFGEYSVFFAYLKVKHFDSMLERLETVIVEDPLIARALFDVVQLLVVWPQVNLLRPIQNMGRDFLPIQTILERGGLTPQRFTMPFEIGSWLMTKLTFYPEGFEACKDVIQHYDRRDLNAVMKALSEGAISKDVDMVRAKSAELENVFDLLWHDAASVNSKVKATKFLIPVSVGIGGMFLNPAAGLLASLGLYAAEKISESTSQSISERIVGRLAPGYVALISDFKNKYDLNQRPIHETT